MKGYFTKKGKYKNGKGVVDATSSDIKNKTVYEIDAVSAQYFMNAGLFVIPSKEAPKKTPVKKAEPVKATNTKK